MTTYQKKHRKQQETQALHDAMQITPSAAGTLIMTGSGDPNANGTYIASGTYNGKPIYINTVSGYALIWNLTNMWQVATADPRTSMWSTPYARSDANVAGAYTNYGGMPPAGTVS